MTQQENAINGTEAKPRIRVGAANGESVISGMIDEFFSSSMISGACGSNCDCKKPTETPLQNMISVDNNLGVEVSDITSAHDMIHLASRYAMTAQVYGDALDGKLLQQLGELSAVRSSELDYKERQERTREVLAQIIATAVASFSIASNAMENMNNEGIQSVTDNLFDRVTDIYTNDITESIQKSFDGTLKHMGFQRN